jgi:hypothetical protein
MGREIITAKSLMATAKEEGIFSGLLASWDKH